MTIVVAICIAFGFVWLTEVLGAEYCNRGETVQALTIFILAAFEIPCWTLILRGTIQECKEEPS